MKRKTERFPVINCLPLRLSFSPDAIREHFESQRVQKLSDRQLAAVGAIALTDDELYAVFDGILRRAFVALMGFDPDDDGE